MKKKRCAICCVLLAIIMGSLWLYQHASKTSTITTTHQELQPNTKQTIVIDAGHGGYDSGSVSEDGVLEKDITLAIALETGRLLEADGYVVVYTRESDEVSWSDQNVEDLAERVTIAEECNAAYFISIHTNASEAYDDGAYGFESYLNYRDATIETMAQAIDENLSALSYSESRGLKSTSDSSLYVIDKNSVPALLVETGFITDRDDATYMMSSDGQQAIARAIADGIIAVSKSKNYSR